MKTLLAIFILVCASAAGAQTPTEKRVALVIGNSAYGDAPLRNPHNDAEDIAAKLRQRGFEVVERRNLKTAQIGRTLREFRSRLAQGAVALVFYAGHGLQINGENFLPTVDADIEGEEDVPNQSLSVRQLLDLLDGARTRLNLVFLDACRNNPYQRRFRSTAGGLARETPPSGTLISFATRPGALAADGQGRNGLYTQYLLKAMDTPNQPVELALKQVVSSVRLASKGQQEPWMEGAIEGDFYFLRETAAAGGAVQQEAINRAVDEAMRRANEQSARERAELQAAMEKMLKEALARQNAALEAERRLREGGAPATPASPAAAAAAAPTAVAAVSRPAGPVAPSVSPPAASGVLPGDEWEYVARDNRFGKKDQRLVLRVRAASADGVLEEIVWNGRVHKEWVFGSHPAAIGSPNEAEFLFAPHWSGADFRQVTIEGGGGQCASGDLRCTLAIERTGRERITTPAGTFETVRIDGWIEVSAITRINAGAMGYTNGRFTIWYSPEHRRLIRQQASNGGRLRADETLELVAIRRGGS